ncbi:extracellular solute-binding protein, family 1 protein [Achromobacter xylosoxidans A8]|uniref:Extracellular solute-binding protein, family 1 protein n=1 Tax=Achromobacter xylosoxidans (strain A8) TaxID=762376 RepID=E3HWD3_ACHXA|nr:substrate-binding domain-containing protein [Achromobacter xylosoxidans]ADP18746.1 extracellular solute-binding protein, family 1 protein [Achromobacter xylosoxidans A8]
MKKRSLAFRIALFWATVFFGGSLQAADGAAAQRPSHTVSLLASGAVSAVHEQLEPFYRQELNLEVAASFGSSLPSVPTSVPRRLERGEAADVVLTSKDSLARLAAQGLVVPESQVDIMKSALGLAVRSGSPIPEIATEAQAAAALLRAGSIAYSSSLSGVYYETEMLKKMRIEEQVLPKSRKISGEKVGAVVARGEAEIGMQQVSELLAVPGIAFVGKLPESLQQYTVFSAGISASAKNPEAARALIVFLARSPNVRQVLSRNGLEPVHAQ